MKKTLLDNYLIGELYQVKNPKGYMSKQDLKTIASFCIVYEEYKHKIEPACENIGEVILKKSDIFFKYNLREALTGVPLNTLYVGRHKKVNCILVEGNKNEYHTFVVIHDDCNSNVQLAKLQEYYAEHKNQEEYRQELISLLKQGKANLEDAKRKENEKIESINSVVRSLVYKKN